MKFILSYNADMFCSLNIEAVDEEAAEKFARDSMTIEEVKRDLKEQIDILDLDEDLFLDIYEKENQNDKTQDSTSSDNPSTGDAGKDVSDIK